MGLSRPFAALLLVAGAARAAPEMARAAYDPNTVETFLGRVATVGTARPAALDGGRAVKSVALVVRKGKTSVAVLLGPAAYVARQGLELREGDLVVVTGSRIRVGAGEIVIAAQVRRGSTVLVLRDPLGRPMWRAARR